jgi:hypothetical protein
MIYKQKICNGCGKVKQPEEYSKCRSRKDGLQPKCKECNKKDNKKFRTQIQPDYYSYETGYFKDKETWKYISLYQLADKTIKIYMIPFDDGSIYIGSTKAHLNIRLARHVADYRRVKEGYSKQSRVIPKLHAKFDEFDDIEDIRKHIIENTVIIDECVGGKTKQYRLEADWILRLKDRGHTLLNTKIPHRYQKTIVK